ncbi:hypothetical protein B0T17DRAFT_494631 [Bombardia bombarda]|uniref:Gluconokinase n=1 Tax=Bombardia bombarda TaxID=252184 RepID=A0AA39WUU9_9PEZI|nr:hypothetical protein B0T17DRAFT_494631 [Bombardia bombarda]
MKAGQPLTDDDRAGWLQKLQALETAEPAAGESPHKVMTCSALKRQYRDVLRGAGADTERKNLRVRFVFFEGSEETLTERTERRKGHFAKENLVSSQFEVLERPTSGEEDVVTVSCEGWRQQTEELMMAAVRDVMRKEGWVFEEEEEEEGEEEEEEDKVPPSTSVSSTV